MSNNADLALLNKLLLAHNGLCKPEEFRTLEEAQLLDNDDEVLEVISAQNALSVITVIRDKIDELLDVLWPQKAVEDETRPVVAAVESSAATQTNLERDVHNFEQKMDRELHQLAAKHGVPVSTLRKQKLPRLHKNKGKRSAYSQFLSTNHTANGLFLAFITLLYLY